MDGFIRGLRSILGPNWLFGLCMLVMTILDSLVTWGVGLSLVPSLGAEGLSFGVLAGALVQLRFVDHGMRRDLGVSVLRGIWVQTLLGLAAAAPAWIVAERLGRFANEKGRSCGPAFSKRPQRA